jgi:glyoxylase-like metal-dependent hydrolase (beta-lactamase superfamily II)
VFNDYVVVLEAAVSSEYAEKCLKLIRETVPNKPIRYLVSTHFHFDHVAGVRPFIAQGVPILTTPDAKQVIKDVAEGRHTMHPDMLSLHPRAPTIETITDHRVIADDAHRLELYEFGPTEHVAQVLLAYFPNEKLLFEPDLLDITSKELVIGVGDTLIMDRKIRALGLDVQRIIPVHGIPGTAETLRAALALRAKYIH